MLWLELLLIAVVNYSTMRQRSTECQRTSPQWIVQIWGKGASLGQRLFSNSSKRLNFPTKFPMHGGINTYLFERIDTREKFSPTNSTYPKLCSPPKKRAIFLTAQHTLLDIITLSRSSHNLSIFHNQSKHENSLDGQGHLSIILLPCWKL